MARNEEKQHGVLNRLWLHKEREEGRLKNVHEPRPKLSTLNSPSSVKKCIPSIKKEIEYYLRQSQLSHYPERKIAEFHLNIEALEKEYRRFITKLRVLDPSCRHTPWTPRPYSKRRGDPPERPPAAKVPLFFDARSGCSGGDGDGWTENLSAPGGSGPPGPSEAPFEEQNLGGGEDQDRPLSFDRTRLAVAAAAFRGASGQRGSSQTQSMVKVLQGGLPNLLRSPSGAPRGPDEGTTVYREPEGNRAERTPRSSGTEERTAHVLGLGYSSSDEDCDTRPPT